MKTFKDLSETEIREFVKIQEQTLNDYKKQNHIGNVLLFGIGCYGNKVISKVKDIPNVTKLFSNAKLLNDGLSNVEKLIFFERTSPVDEFSDKNNFDDIYNHIIKNEKIITDKIQKFDFIIICTSSDNLTNNYLTEAVADIFQKFRKRFIICYARENASYGFYMQEDLSLERSREFFKKIKTKKYLVNEISNINGNFIYDKIPLNYLGLSCFIPLNTGIYNQDVNTSIFADILEINIKKILEI